jgi:AraC-like DNA-binding protein
VIESGAQAYWYRGSRHVTPQGHVFLVSPDEPHTGEAAASGGYVYRTLNAPKNFLTQVAQELGLVGVPSFKGAVLDDSTLVDLLRGVHRCLIENGASIECETRILSAMSHLVRHHSHSITGYPSLGKEVRATRRAREYLECCFSDNISLSELAAIVGLSPFYLARCFDRQVGIPPHAYLEGVRVRKARELMDKGVKLAEAAIAVGYSEQSHLTRRFKRVLGITPGQYLRESKIRQDRGQ